MRGPQFIKAAVVSRAITEHNKLVSGQLITEVIVHTGQHYDQNMSDVFFEEMHIRWGLLSSSEEKKINYLPDLSNPQ